MSDKLSIPRKVVKAIAMVVGAAGTCLCLMAVTGLITASGWVRVPVALVVTIVVPAVLADRVLPDTDEKPKGLVSDVFALTWLAIPLIVAVVLGGLTKRMLTVEGDRLSAAGYGSIARGAYLLAGVDATPVGQSPALPGSASATASAAASAATSAAVPTAVPSAAPAATASATATASASASASAKPVDPPGGDDGKLPPAEIFKKYAAAVVTVSVSKATAQGGGTGFLLDRKGTIATNHHVIDGADQAKIRFMNGSTFEQVWILMSDPAADLALLQIDLSQPDDGEPVDVEPVVLGDSDKIVVGEEAISIGNPLGLAHTMTTGIVSSRRTYRGKQWIQMSTPISPGNSGGPVFNAYGEVIGVSTASVGGGFGGGQNLNLAVPIDVLKGKIRPDYPGKRKFGTAGGASTW